MTRLLLGMWVCTWCEYGMDFFYTHFFVSNTLLICQWLNRTNNGGIFFCLVFFFAIKGRFEMMKENLCGKWWKRSKLKEKERKKRWKLVTLYRGSRRCFVWWGRSVERIFLSSMKNYIFLLIPVGVSWIRFEKDWIWCFLFFTFLLFLYVVFFIYTYLVRALLTFICLMLVGLLIAYFVLLVFFFFTFFVTMICGGRNAIFFYFSLLGRKAELVI